MKTKNITKWSIALSLAVVFAFSVFVPHNRQIVSASSYDPVLQETLAQEIAENGMVLLENNGVLPLTPEDDVVGQGLGNTIYGGLGSGVVLTNRTCVSYDDGMKAAKQEGLIKSYSSFSTAPGNKLIYCISRMGSEESDVPVETVGRTGYYLTNNEKRDLTTLCERFGSENVIIILNTGSVIDTTYLKSLNVGAIVAAYFGGNTSGLALKNLLTGKSNFSGKSPDTWATSYEKYPSVSVGEFGVQGSVQYTEDVFVGYRYFSTFDPEYTTVNYEFGYGLSYTNFSLTEQKVDVSNGEVEASVKVTNTGSVAGRETVQLYYKAPSTVSVGEDDVYFGTPARELGGFYKTDLLQPGESETVKIRYSVDDMAVYDDLDKIRKDTYQLLAGDYDFYLGTSVKNASNEFEGYAPYRVVETRQVSDQLTSLRDSMADKRLLANGGYETVGLKRVAPGGATVVQAEHFSAKKTLYQPRTGDTATTEASLGVGYFYVLGQLHGHVGEWVEYKLNVEKAGSYRLGAAIAIDTTALNSDAVNIYVNSEKQNVRLNYSGLGNWSKYGYYNLQGELQLPEGEVTLRVENRSGALGNLDYLVIWNDAVSENGKTIIEGESNADQTACYGNGGAALVNAKDKTLDYTVNVATAGKYKVRLYASNMTNASAKSANVSVNGIEQGEFSLMRTAFNGEGAQENNKYVFAWTNTVEVDLPEGSSTLSIKALDTSMYALDFIEITSKSTQTPEYEFKNNTEEFREVQENPNYNGSVTYHDVMQGKVSEEEFVESLSAEELIAFSGLERKLSNNGNGAGGFGAGAYNNTLKRSLPTVYAADAAAGIGLKEKGNVVWFPCATLIAATFDSALAERYGEAMGETCNSFGFGMWLAPSVNIHRNPLCGRNFEYYSEDPLLAGKIGASAVRGAQSKHVAVCVKHFAVNNQETTRFSSNSCLSNRALREIYLRPFEIIVKESNPWAIMSSYNLVNGEYVSNTRELITDVLRGEWGFSGVVFSDWWASGSHSGMLNAGNNVKCDNPDYADALKAYNAGLITRETLEENAETVLKLMLRIQGCSEDSHTYSDEWISDETHHWRVAICDHNGEIVGYKSEHTFENDACTVCGYKKIDNEQPGGDQPQPDEPTGNNGWIIYTVISGVAGIALTAGAVIIIKKKKNKK